MAKSKDDTPEVRAKSAADSICMPVTAAVLVVGQLDAVQP